MNENQKIEVNIANNLLDPNPRVDLPNVDPNPERQPKMEVIHPTLAQLLEFEELSWPNPAERATNEDLKKRMNAFPEGIFMLLADGEPVAQITGSPKNIFDPDTIDSFERMRDMEVDRKSPVLWITNMASRADAKGKGYVSTLMSAVIAWATENGYQSVMAGVTCDGYTKLKEEGKVASIDEYMEKFGNPGVNTFRSAARKSEQNPENYIFVWNSDPIADYWPEDKESEGFGVMVEVDLNREALDNRSWIIPSLDILERISEEHFVAAAVEAVDDYPRGHKEMHGRSARKVYYEYRKYRNLPLAMIEEAKEKYFQQHQEKEAILSDLDNQLMRKERISELWLSQVMREADLYYSLFELLRKLANRKKEMGEIAEAKKETIEFRYDLSAVNNLGVEGRQTITGQENTMFLLLPAVGCKMDCEHCSPKHLAHPDYRVTVESATEAVEQTREFLRQNDGVQTLKLFNAGNILWGSEFGKAAALHERYWDLLPEILIDYPDLLTIEIEVRLDEFSEKIANPEIQTLDKKQIVRDRLFTLNNNLKKIGKELRVILAPEYADNIIAKQQGTVAKGIRNARAAVDFLKKNEIPWLGYTMFGGRLKDRTILPVESLESVIDTTKYILDSGGREAVINCQYLDPINQDEERKDGIRYYVPNKRAINDLLKMLFYKRIISPDRRVRISVDKEDSIIGTVGAADLDPSIDRRFLKLIANFNNADDQRAFLMKEMALTDDKQERAGFLKMAEISSGVEKMMSNTGIDLLIFDLPFHSDPRLRESSFSDFGRVQEVPRGALSVATHLNRRNFDTKVVPMDAFMHQDYKRYCLLKPEEIGENSFFESLHRVFDEQIRKYNPRVIGISYMFSPNRRSMLEIVRYLKETYRRPVILGGNAATLEKMDDESGVLERAMLSPDGGADLIVNYEGEAPMAKVMKKLADADFDLSKVDLSKIEGITYFDNDSDKVVSTAAVPRGEGLGQSEDDFDPDYAGGLDYNLLTRFEGMDLRDFNNYALFSRGCKGCCEFCTSRQFWKGAVTPIGLLSFKSELINLAEEISSYSSKINRNENVLERERIKEIGLLDDDILLELSFHKGRFISTTEKFELIGKNRGAEIETKTVFEVIKPTLDEIKERYPDLQFMIQTRYGHLRDEQDKKEGETSERELELARLPVNNLIHNQDNYLSMLKETGVKRVYLGMESADQGVLDEVRKLSHVDWLISSCQMIKKAGLEVGLFWIIGLPGSNVEAEEKTLAMIEFLIENKLIDEFEAHIFVPLPGTKGAKSNLIKLEVDNPTEISYISGKPVHQCIDKAGEITLSGQQMEDYWAKSKKLAQSLQKQKIIAKPTELSPDLD